MGFAFLLVLFVFWGVAQFVFLWGLLFCVCCGFCDFLSVGVVELPFFTWLMVVVRVCFGFCGVGGRGFLVFTLIVWLVFFIIKKEFLLRVYSLFWFLSFGCFIGFAISLGVLLGFVSVGVIIVKRFVVVLF